ncbi:Gfo/Idh/MocA family oxidoreductase [Maritimibacter sp. UBA3975]|uniref:Gfo/Idh/MocA family protein n=1 Tax=Maritimibacter sp. UBA3975 TaxID=1946833 RepID=UPI000C0BB3A4|nr:Gfo/Idh/MocA family oxidoreductase [Maritimibacter sp. UBA3975]MAM62996.1 hypothetical protein [Maritimibacter sp.]|tara:strand:- start:2213 stop:3193 length:981 start_codon:yes stop_codon:yes gene_type:complete
MTQSSRTLALLGGAHVHLPDHLRMIDARGWRIGHVHDRDTARRDRLCAELGAKPLDTLDGLSGLDVAGVVVCSETAHHDTDIPAALEAGLPVFSEKPLTGRATAARAIADRAADAGVLLQTGYFFRTVPALQTARDWITEGRVGRVSAARMMFCHNGGYAGWLDLNCWMTDPALACYDGFVDEAVHVIDALQWMLGPIADGHAITGNALGWPVDDHGVAVVTFSSGATGVVEAGWTDTRMRLELDIVGDDGAISLRDEHLTLTPRDADGPAEHHRLDPLDSGTGILPFLDALDGRAAPALVPPDEAASVNDLLDAMNLRLPARDPD